MSAIFVIEANPLSAILSAFYCLTLLCHSLTNTMKKSSFLTLSKLAALATLAVLSGCNSYTSQTKGLSGAWKSGDMLAASEIATKEATARANTRDAILWHLEHGAVLRAAGDLEGSNKAFDEAETKVNEWEEKAKVRVSAETGAILTNQSMLTYRGRAYDKVMMNTYKALNYLALNDYDSARVELNRALQRQRDAVDENAKRIEDAQELADKAKDGTIEVDEGTKQEYDVDRAMEDPKTGPALEAALAEANSRLGSYADYVNPFSVWLDGIYFSTVGYDNSDAERGRKSLERAATFNPSNVYLQQDFEVAEAVARGGSVPAVTYVIFETGMAPYRDELRIDIPTFIVTSSIGYVGAAFPRLKFNDLYNPGLAVMADGQLLNTLPVSNMDSVIARDFKNEWPSIVTKTLISTATKAIAQYAAQKAVENQDWKVRLAVMAAGALTQAALNSADLRTWMTLPKEFQYARFPTPEDSTLTLSAGLQTTAVTIEPGKINVVYVRSITPEAPLIVSQFILQ